VDFVPRVLLESMVIIPTRKEQPMATAATVLLENLRQLLECPAFVTIARRGIMYHLPAKTSNVKVALLAPTNMKKGNRAA
jgi:hypothetical protein